MRPTARWTPSGLLAALLVLVAANQGQADIPACLGQALLPRLASLLVGGQTRATGANGPLVCSEDLTATSSPELWVVSLDGSVTYRLTNDGTSARHPAWSPDARRILFRCHSPGGYTDLWVINSDGTGLQRLTNDSFQEYDPAWSPDGQKIAFGGREGPGDTQLYIANADGSNRTCLTSGPDTMGSPWFSPDSQRILFNRFCSPDGELRVINIDGSGETVLLSGLRWPGHPAWSPDGQTMSFSAMADDSRELFMVNADGSGLTQLTYNVIYDHHMTWSPDSQQLAFDRGVPGQLYAMNRDGTGVRRVSYHLPSAAQPAWPPAPWVPRCLAWLATPGYIEDGVEPDAAEAGAGFTFRARYFQPDGEPPAVAQCRVQRLVDGVWQDYQLLDLQLESGTADTGAIYACATDLAAGRYRYRFIAVDSRGELPGLPTDYHEGPSTAAELTWASLAGYGNDGVDPESGRTGDTFTFMVTYADPAGGAPLAADCQLQRQVDGAWQDEAVVPMEYMLGDPVFGARYRASVVLSSGSYRYRFAFANADGAVAGSPADYHEGPLVSGLEWAGGAAYTGSGVAPTVGNPDTPFVLKARYTSPIGLEPTSSACRLQRRVGGLWQNFATEPMLLESGTTATGATYSCSMTVPPGAYRHSFIFYDVEGAVPGPPAAHTDGPAVPRGLDWVGTEGYAGDGVDPDSGPDGATFTFKAKYLNLAGGTPTEADCHLQRHDGAAWQDYASVPMSLESGDPSSGAIYACSTQLAAGWYRHWFAFVDAEGAVPGAPSSGESGPVTSSLLAWTGGLGYETDGVDPDVGGADTQFAFRVEYVSTSGEAPSTAECLLRRKAGAAWEDQPPLSLSLESGDPLTGSIYMASTTLTPGRYQYCFHFTNSGGNVPGEPVEYRDGPVNGPRLAWAGKAGFLQDGVDPNVGNPDSTSYRFRVQYCDPSGGKPLTKRCLLVRRVGNKWQDYASLALSRVSGNVTSGIAYECGTQLPNGVFMYRFKFRTAGGALLVDDAPTQWSIGPSIIGPPTLAWAGSAGYTADGVSPDSGATGTRFRFRVRYYDGEGDAPDTHRLVIRKNGGQLSYYDLRPAATGDHVKGKVYSVSVVVNRVNALEYRFDFADDDGPATGEPTEWRSGPVIGGSASMAVSALTALPTHAGVDVRFALSAQARVTAVVLNVAGRPVRTIASDRPSQAGLQTLLWDARADTGLRVPGGTYLVRLTARAEDGSQSTALATVRLR